MAEFVDPTSNPEASNAAIASLLSGSTAEVAPTIAPQPHGFVRLPGGLVRGPDPTQVSYEAEVRELTGEDEEYIDRIRQGRPDRFVEAVLERGVVKVGDLPSSKQIISELLLGDAEFLMVEIRRATYGETVEYSDVTCPHCLGSMDLIIEIDDIPVTPLESTEARYFEVPLRKGGKAHVRMPRFSDLSSEFQNDKLTEAERKTLLLSRVVMSIESPSGERTAIEGSPDAARHLSSADRNAIVNALGKRRVGPAYNEVKFTHDACGEEVPFPITMGDLFPDL